MARADVIVVNADVRTMDIANPRAEALAIAGGRILSAGSERDIRALAGPQTEVVDAGGRLVLPGFHDTHLHVQDGGQHYVVNADLSSARTPQDMIAILSDWASRRDDPWLYGGFYDQSLFGADVLSRAVLDAAIPDRPCMILSADAHNGCINSAAIRATGLGRDTPDPENGHFVRDASGEATGMLYERATHWVEERMPPFTEASFSEGVLLAQALANKHGITGVLDASVGERHARIYKELVAREALTVRVIATARVDANEATEAALARVERLRAENQFEMFRIHSAKFFLDGVIENRTAAMIEDYSDATGGNAPLMFDPEQVIDLFKAFDAARFQIHVHAIGDMATRAALDGMEAARKANGPWPSHHHIAHIQCIDPADVPRFRDLGVVANVQPLWAHHGPSVDELTVDVIGPERSKWIYAFRSLKDAGALMTLSSDWTVSTLNPFKIMQTAITRRSCDPEDNAPAFLPEQSLTIEDCVKGYTIDAATSGWRAGETGSLAPGKFADFIVVDQDIYACDPEAIGKTEVLLTALSGKPVWNPAGLMRG